jgi:uncharacterized protein DUF6551
VAPVQTPEFVKELHANSKIEKIQLSKLHVDSSYQRDISEKLVDEIAGNWDVIASELILVSNRGQRPTDGEVRGGLFIVNGQHRSKAAAKLGLTEIDARIIDLRKEEDPAAIEAAFRLKTNVRLGDRSLERFKAQLRAGDPESIAIRDLLQQFDTEINQVPNSEVGINAVVTIEEIYRVDDGALLRDVLTLVKDVWKHVGGDYTKSPLLKGIAWFIEKHANETDRSRLVHKLEGIGSTVLEQRSRTIKLTMGGSLWVNYYRAIVELYNEQLREKHRLQWKLRGSQRLRAGGGQDEK